MRWFTSTTRRSPNPLMAARVGGPGVDSPSMYEDVPKSHRGAVYLNPVTGERSLVLIGTGDDKGDRLAVQLSVRPGGAVVAAHYHPTVTERFRVLSGRLEVLFDGSRSTLEPGTDVTVPPGTVHDWWNAGDQPAEVLVDVVPGRRFELMVTTRVGARQGREDKREGDAES